LLDALSVGLRRLPSTRSARLPRMADFCLWALACVDGVLWPEGAFLSAYDSNHDDAVGGLLDADPLASAVGGLLDKQRIWRGTATNLLASLGAIAGDANSRSWPRNGRALSGRLRRLASSLRKAGIKIDFERSDGRTRTRIISINLNSENEPLQPSAPSGPSKPMTFQ
jgi:hypothetical protein